MTTINFAKRTHGCGTSVPSSAPRPAESHECSTRIATPEEIAQMLSKYPPTKLRPPKPEILYERHIRPQKASGQA